MRNLNGFKWIYALAVLSITASADLIIDNQTIPGSDIQSITISPVSGNIFVSTTPGYDVTLTAFTASPLTITEGQTTTLSWTTANATSCTPTGGTGGWSNRAIALPNGSTNITINIAGTYGFTLTCQGDSGTPAVRNISVTANSQPTNTGTCPAPTLVGSERSWASLFIVGFPGPGYDNRFATIPRTGYYALKFNTGNVVDDGKMSSIETTVTDGVRLGAFSECPGIFDVAPECTYIWGNGGGIRWATNGRSGACQLKPNTDYYFNITYTDGVSGATTSCYSSPCITTLQHVNQ
jgi:hypothetical protein